MNSVERLKCDVQQTLANNCDSFLSKYETLFFGDDYKKYLMLFKGFEKMEISTSNDMIDLKVKISKEILDTLSEKQKQKLTTISWKIQMQDLSNQILNENNSFIDNTNYYDDYYLDDFKKETNQRKILSEEEKEMLTIIKQKIKEAIGLDMNIKVTNETVGFEMEKDIIFLNKTQLIRLSNIAEDFDFFVIVPKFYERKKSADKVRFFLGIRNV